MRTLKSYEVVAENYAVVTLDDDSTFGQCLLPGDQSSIDEQIKLAVYRQQPAVTETVTLGVRSKADVDALTADVLNRKG